jgi:hypothetical protein
MWIAITKRFACFGEIRFNCHDGVPFVVVSRFNVVAFDHDILTTLGAVLRP